MWIPFPSIEEEVGVDVVLSLWWLPTYSLSSPTMAPSKAAFRKRCCSTRPLNLLFQIPRMLGIYQIAWEDAYNWKNHNWDNYVQDHELFTLQKQSFSNFLNIFLWMMKRLFMNIELIWVLSVLLVCFASHYDMAKLQLLVQFN
jgi:hypothetical protein